MPHLSDIDGELLAILIFGSVWLLFLIPVLSTERPDVERENYADGTEAFGLTNGVPHDR